MPSDTMVDGIVDQALDAMKGRVDAFHSAVSDAEEDLRTFLSHRRGSSEFRGEQALIELGPFAVGRIDPERFAALLGNEGPLTPEAEEVIELAGGVFEDFAESAEDLLRVVVPSGGDLRDAVKEALSGVGRVFGAARAVELARGGNFDPAAHNGLLSPLPFRKWHRAERNLAPPLIVEVEAEDLFPAGLGEFLDGGVKIVLVVRGRTPPAPLARLITPGTFVMQTATVADLEKMAASMHPGVALVFDDARDSQARFYHDPERGSAPWQRIHIEHLPEDPDVGRGRRDPTWLEELEHLRMLSTPPAGAAAGAVEEGLGQAPEAPTSADQLAAWLLEQTDLGGV